MEQFEPMLTDCSTPSCMCIYVCVCVCVCSWNAAAEWWELVRSRWIWCTNQRCSWQSAHGLHHTTGLFCLSLICTQLCQLST